jgi:hypothetical protein
VAEPLELARQRIVALLVDAIQAGLRTRPVS